jgi:hypothetical protein
MHEDFQVMAEQVELSTRSSAVPNRKLIFLSCASPDRGTAERLAGEIEATGIPCWMAPRDVPGALLPNSSIPRVRRFSFERDGQHVYRVLLRGSAEIALAIND